MKWKMGREGDLMTKKKDLEIKLLMTEMTRECVAMVMRIHMFRDKLVW